MKTLYTYTHPATGAKFDLRWNELNDTAKEYIIFNGYKQSMGDSASGKKGQDALGALEARQEKILAGTVSSSNGGARDPLGKEISLLLAGLIEGWSKMKAKEREPWLEEVRHAKKGTDFEKVLNQAQARLDVANNLTSEIKLEL